MQNEVKRGEEKEVGSGREEMEREREGFILDVKGQSEFETNEVEKLDEEIEQIMLEKLYNFRDVFARVKGCKKGLLFRGANLCSSSSNDASFIAHSLGVKTLIDLRSGGERGKNEEQKLLGELHRYFLSPNKYSSLQYYHNPLTNFAFSLQILFRSNFSAILDGGRWLMKGSMDEMKKVITQSAFDNMSLVHLYCLFLTYCQSEILSVLRIVGDAEKLPAVYFCTAGKDRTGIITMLIQSICDVEEEIILSDYQISHSLLLPIHSDLQESFLAHGITNLHFIETPAYVMKEVIEFLKSKYGSISKYLIAIGFSLDDQTRLRDIFLL